MHRVIQASRRLAPAQRQVQDNRRACLLDMTLPVAGKAAFIVPLYNQDGFDHTAS